jgi:hypothetical protein
VEKQSRCRPRADQAVAVVTEALGFHADTTATVDYSKKNMLIAVGFMEICTI